MKTKIIALEEQEYKGNYILRPNEIEIESNDIYMIDTNFKTISVGTGLIRLTNKSFKDLKKLLIKNKSYEKIMVL